tara:strand:- start:7786 stop:8586 length:801 start_codon:yes stop_codon:yes gene_type:complete
MNFITVVAEGAHEQADALLTALEQNGGVGEDDKLVIFCSIYDAAYTTSFMEKANKLSPNVELFARSINPYLKGSLVDYSDKVFFDNAMQFRAVGPTCYFAASLYPQADWVSEIKKAYHFGGKEYMGATTPAKAGDVPHIEGPFVCDHYSFNTIPMLRFYNAVDKPLHGARNYTANRTHSVTMPFSTAAVKAPVAVVETSEPTFDPNVARKIEALPAAPIKPAAKKAPTKKKAAKKKVSNKKTTKKRAPRKPISAEVIASVETQITQ